MSGKAFAVVNAGFTASDPATPDSPFTAVDQWYRYAAFVSGRRRRTASHGGSRTSGPIRESIELLFKWMKQHLPIKACRGTSSAAV